MTGSPKSIMNKSSKHSSEEFNAKKAARNILTQRNVGIVFLYLAILFFISPSPNVSLVSLNEDDPAPELILARIDFDVVDEDATRLAQEQAASLEPPVYVFDPELVADSLQNARNQFDKIQQDALNTLFTTEERIALLSKYLSSSTSTDTLNLLANIDPEDFETLRSSSLEATKALLGRGILSDFPGSAKHISIYEKESHSWRLMEVDDVLTLEKAPDALDAEIEGKFADSEHFRTALIELSTSFLNSTLRFDETLTADAKKGARKSTPAVMRRIKKNEFIVEAGHTVTRQDVLEYRAHARELAQANMVKVKLYAGNAMLLLMAFGCFLFYLKRFRPGTLQDNKKMLLIGIMFLMTMASGWLVMLLPVPSVFLYVVPVAAGGILLSILADDRMALVYSFFVSVLFCAQGGYQINFLLLGVFGSLAGIYYMRTIRRRGDIMRPGIAVAIANVVTIIMLYLTGNLQQEFGSVIIAGIANGAFTALGVVPGTLTFLEWLLGIATNIRLLELSDLNHPLLKQMAMQAPGTYHHCLMVGNLAEDAAEKVGANSLLARVGSYYHDVGKMNKPLYFSENQGGGKNKHDDLTPNMSALILTSHTKEGVEMARESRLNQPIIDFIEQHHGTSLMPFFYQKAMEQSASHDVSEENFRYPGPRPQSRETAICMLADSVEAASRTLTNPTHGRIKGMVEKITNNKFIDSQLDECDLTLKDIHAISDSFVRVLAGYLHSRVEYPEEQTVPEIKEKFENTSSKDGKKAADKNRPDPKSN